MNEKVISCKEPRVVEGNIPTAFISLEAQPLSEASYLDTSYLKVGEAKATAPCIHVFSLRRGNNGASSLSPEYVTLVGGPDLVQSFMTRR